MKRPTTLEVWRARYGSWPIEALRVACLEALPDTPHLALRVAAWISRTDVERDPPPMSPAQVRRISEALEQCSGPP